MFRVTSSLTVGFGLLAVLASAACGSAGTQAPSAVSGGALAGQAKAARPGGEGLSSGPVLESASGASRAQVAQAAVTNPPSPAPAGESARAPGGDRARATVWIPIPEVALEVPLPGAWHLSGDRDALRLLNRYTPLQEITDEDGALRVAAFRNDPNTPTEGLKESVRILVLPVLKNPPRDVQSFCQRASRELMGKLTVERHVASANRGTLHGRRLIECAFDSTERTRHGVTAVRMRLSFVFGDRGTMLVSTNGQRGVDSIHRSVMASVRPTTPE